MTIKTEANGIYATSGSHTGTIGTTNTETIGGISGIKYNADATFQYVQAFKEKIDGDHFIDKEGGKVDHNHPISPSRTSGTDAIASL